MTGRPVLQTLALVFLLALITPTLTANSVGWWSTPARLSDWQDMVVVSWLRIGNDGTQLAYWLMVDSVSGKGSVQARVRPPGGSWGDIEDIIGWTQAYSTRIWRVALVPDGTVWTVWALQDPSRPVGSQFKVKAVERRPDGTRQEQDLSGWLAQVRHVHLGVGPDGDLAAVWVQCNTTSTTPADGPCYVGARLRPAGALTWSSTQQLKSFLGFGGVNEAYAMVGADGKTVVIWDEVHSSSPGHWGVMADAYDPATGVWDAVMTQVSGWVEPRSVQPWLAFPVMDPGGTVTVAWTAKTGFGSPQDALYSATRAASAGTWSTPTQISGAHPANSLPGPGRLQLAVGQNGTTIAAWQWKNASNHWFVVANARDPLGTWGSEQQVSSSLVTDAYLCELEVWPRGKAVVVWQGVDTTRPPTADEGVFWSARIPFGTWATGGEGQLGTWYPEVGGVALELCGDGSGTAVWAVTDASQQGAVVAAFRPPGGPWQAPESVMEGYKKAELYHVSLDARSDCQYVGAVWQVQRDAAASTPDWAVLYSQWQKGIHLPAVLRQSP